MTPPLGWIGAIAADARPLDDGPESARRVAQSVVERISELRSFPRIGRLGRVEGTREIAFPPLQYVAVYEILDAQDEVRVFRVLHGAQQWPPRQR